MQPDDEIDFVESDRLFGATKDLVEGTAGVVDLAQQEDEVMSC
jgi:hypothetical protein